MLFHLSRFQHFVLIRQVITTQDLPKSDHPGHLTFLKLSIQSVHISCFSDANQLDQYDTNYFQLFSPTFNNVLCNLSQMELIKADLTKSFLQIPIAKLCMK